MVGDHPKRVIPKRLPRPTMSSWPPAKAHRLNSTQRGLLLDALSCYRRQLPPALANELHQLIYAAAKTTYFLEDT